MQAGDEDSKTRIQHRLGGKKSRHVVTERTRKSKFKHLRRQCQQSNLRTCCQWFTPLCRSLTIFIHGDDPPDPFLSLQTIRFGVALLWNSGETKRHLMA